MNKLLWIFVGGGLGSIARYYLGKWFNGADLLMPYGTFSANVLGSFFIGFLTGIFISRHWINTQWAPAILIGFLGGFTTFSTFTFESLHFIRQGQWESFLAYFFSSLIIGLFSVAFGFYLSRFV